jgi:hypothetical protein
VQQRDQILRLQNELDETKRTLFELKEREKSAAACVNISSIGASGNIGGGGGGGSPPAASSGVYAANSAVNGAPPGVVHRIASASPSVPVIRAVQQRTASPRSVLAARPTTPKAAPRVDSPRRPLGL